MNTIQTWKPPQLVAHLKKVRLVAYTLALARARLKARQVAAAASSSVIIVEPLGRRRRYPGEFWRGGRA